MKFRPAALAFLLFGFVAIVLIYNLKRHFDPSFEENVQTSENIKVASLLDPAALNSSSSLVPKSTKATIYLKNTTIEYKESASKKYSLILDFGIAIMALSALLVHVLRFNRYAKPVPMNLSVLFRRLLLICLAPGFFYANRYFKIFKRKETIIDNAFLKFIYPNLRYNFMSSEEINILAFCIAKYLGIEEEDLYYYWTKLERMEYEDVVTPKLSRKYIVIYPTTRDTFPEMLPASRFFKLDSRKERSDEDQHLQRYTVLEASTFNNDEYLKEFEKDRSLEDSQSYQFHLIAMYQFNKHVIMFDLVLNNRINNFLYNSSFDTVKRIEEKYLRTNKLSNSDMMKEVYDSLEIVQLQTSRAIIERMKGKKQTDKIMEIYEDPKFVSARNCLKTAKTEGSVKYNIQYMFFYSRSHKNPQKYIEKNHSQDPLHSNPLMNDDIVDFEINVNYPSEESVTRHYLSWVINLFVEMGVKSSD